MSESQQSGAWVEDPDVMLDRPDSTGVPRVDGVIDAVSAIGSVPLDGHVGIYERAHVELRAALDHPDAVVSG